MPTYQYVCTDPQTRHEFELVQSFTDEPVRECPECGSRVRKVYGSVGVVFKGSGFYRTDNRSGSSSGESTDGASSSKEGSKKESSKKEGSAKEPSSTPGSAAGSSSKSSSSSTSSSGSKAAATG